MWKRYAIHFASRRDSWNGYKKQVSQIRHKASSRSRQTTRLLKMGGFSTWFGGRWFIALQPKKTRVCVCVHYWHDCCTIISGRVATAKMAAACGNRCLFFGNSVNQIHRSGPASLHAGSAQADVIAYAKKSAPPSETATQPSPPIAALRGVFFDAASGRYKV